MAQADFNYWETDIPTGFVSESTSSSVPYGGKDSDGNSNILRVGATAWAGGVPKALGWEYDAATNYRDGIIGIAMRRESGNWDDGHFIGVYFRQQAALTGTVLATDVDGYCVITEDHTDSGTTSINLLLYRIDSGSPSFLGFKTIYTQTVGGNSASWLQYNVGFKNNASGNVEVYTRYITAAASSDRLSDVMDTSDATWSAWSLIATDSSASKHSSLGRQGIIHWNPVGDVAPAAISYYYLDRFYVMGSPNWDKLIYP